MIERHNRLGATLETGRGVRPASLWPLRAPLGAAMATILCLSPIAGPAMASEAGPRAANGTAPTDLAAREDDSGLADDIEVLRREFAAWWNQPAGPSASQGFVRKRAEERRRAQEQAALEAERRRFELPPPTGPQTAAPVSAPLPALRPLDFAAPAAASLSPSELGAGDGLGRASVFGLDEGEGLITSTQPAAEAEPPAAAEEPPAATERRKLAALLGVETPARAGAPSDQGLETELAHDPATAPSTPSAVSTAAPDVEVRPLAPVAEAGAAAPTAQNGGLSRSPDWETTELETVPASSGGVWRREVQPAPTPSAAAYGAPRPGESGFAAQATVEDRSVFSDPTVRIGLAFLVGVGILCLAFLREWSAARRRYG